jgi:CubicO group peptidase (beta-lactamase class C family)
VLSWARIFEPLGTKDTGFHVPPENVEQLTTCYMRHPASGERAVFEARGGRFGISACTDPKEEMIGGLLCQRIMDSPALPPDMGQVLDHRLSGDRQQNPSRGQPGRRRR